MAEISYDYAKKVFHNQYTISDAKFEVARISGMNPGSAQDYIIDFNAMMQGEEYKRTMKNSDSKMFIENIKRDYGKIYFDNAIKATWAHIHYYENLTGTNLKTKRKMLNNLMNQDRCL